MRSSLLVDKYRNYIYLDDLFQLSCYFFLILILRSFPGTKNYPIKITVGSIYFKTKKLYVLGIYDLTKNKLIFCEPTTSDNHYFLPVFITILTVVPDFSNTMANDSTMVMG